MKLYTMFTVKSISLWVFIGSGFCAECDGTETENFIANLDHYNNLLYDFAKLGKGINSQNKANGGHGHNERLVQETQLIFHAPQFGEQSQKYYGEPERQSDTEDHLLHSKIQASYKLLHDQQTHLDSIADSCIPDNHKPRIASAMAKTFAIYLSQEKNLKALGKLIEVPDVGTSGRRYKREVSAPTDISSDETDSGTDNTDPSSTALSQGPISPTSYGAPVPTNASSSSTPTDSTIYSSAADSTSTDSSTPGSTNGSDSSSGDATSTEVPAQTPASTRRPGIIFRAIDGTYHLLTGAIHLAERILHIGGRGSTTPGIISAPESGSSGESELLADLINNVAHRYTIPL